MAAELRPAGVRQRRQDVRKNASGQKAGNSTIFSQAYGKRMHPAVVCLPPYPMNRAGDRTRRRAKAAGRFQRTHSIFYPLHDRAFLDVKYPVDLKAIIYELIQSGTGDDGLDLADAVEQIILAVAIQF